MNFKAQAKKSRYSTGDYGTMKLMKNTSYLKLWKKPRVLLAALRVAFAIRFENDMVREILRDSVRRGERVAVRRDGVIVYVPADNATDEDRANLVDIGIGA